MDFQLTCRVCLEVGEVVSLFDWDENNEQLVSKYTYCCGVEVSETDMYPTSICVNCVDRMTFSYQFKQQCLTSNEILKECMEKVFNNDAQQTEKELDQYLKEELPDEESSSEITGKSQKRYMVTRKSGRRPRKCYNQTESHSNKKKTKVKEIKREHSNERDDDNGDDKYFVDDVDHDPDFSGQSDNDPEYKEEPMEELLVERTSKKRGRQPKKESEKVVKKKSPPELVSDVDMLLKETILAKTEPIPENVLNLKNRRTRYAKGTNPRMKQERKAPRSHTCETCGASFDSPSALKVHIQRHLGIKPYVCGVCSYSCVVKMELNRHMLKHTGVKPFECRICQKRFTDYGTRQKHERVHAGLKPYICSVCGKAFSYAYVLRNHMLTHTGEKNFSCEPCNRKFTKLHHLKYHYKIHHKDLYRKMVEETEAKKAKEIGLIVQNDGSTPTEIIEVPIYQEEVVIDEAQQAVVELQEVSMKS